jgi:hypothetical protein
MMAKLSTLPLVEIGEYRHFRGDLYRVVSTATHAVTGEIMVLYQNISGQSFVRPIDNFLEEIEVDGSLVPRFKPVTE